MNSEVNTIKIAGPAGTGIKSAGLLLSQILATHGFYTHDYSEYPSLVRGGHNTYQVSFSRNPIYSPYQKVNLFFSLSPNHHQHHLSEFDRHTLVLGEDTPNQLPLDQLTSQIGGSIYANTVCLGVIAYLYSLGVETSQKVISNQFGSSSPNLHAFEIGYDYAKAHLGKYQYDKTYKYIDKHQYIYDGNEAFGWGFINAGGSFYAAYPMTPATGVLHFLAQKQTQYDIRVVHPEDEIAAASMAAGAAFASARAAVGTSGGGFALMTETVSLCGAANFGVVFYLSQRPGPATGMPTWTSQGDLLFAIHSGHGEFNKIVLAPGDQYESFELAVSALNLAAKFNLPVIVLSDKFISESSSSLPNLSQKKVKLIESKLKFRLANSYEHDSDGFSTEESSQVVTNTLARLRQQKHIINSLPKPTLYGNNQAKNLIISWGSTKGPILEAIKNNPKYAFLQLKSLWPIDPNLRLLIRPFKKVVVIENNATSQLTTLLKSQFDFNPITTILKFDGRPFFPEELLSKLK